MLKVGLLNYYNMANVFVRVKGWEHTGDTFKVVYSTWDGKCTCTSQHHTGKIVSDFTDSPELTTKREIHEQILKQLYGS